MIQKIRDRVESDPDNEEEVNDNEGDGEGENIVKQELRYGRLSCCS